MSALSAPPPALSVVGCADHRAVADEIAACSITLVRDRAGPLPLCLDGSWRLAVVLPQPLDLTPADTSSFVTPDLAQALRAFHPQVDEIIAPHRPGEQDIAAVLTRIQACGAVILGTLNAYPQPEQAVLRTGLPVVVVALRLPCDLPAFPAAPTYLCMYSLQDPALLALARVLFGAAPPRGRLPVSIPGLYPHGHGEARRKVLAGCRAQDRMLAGGQDSRQT